MWRWLHSLPRALRNQVHGPRASAGICVEEEQKCKENVVRTDEVCVKKENSRRRLCWKAHCICARADRRKNGSSHGRESEKSTFWNLSHGPLTGLDAVGWGGFFIVSLQLSRFKQYLDSRHRPEDNSIYFHNLTNLLYKVVRALPKGDAPSAVPQYLGPAAEKAATQTQQTPKSEENHEPKHETCEVEKAADEFNEVCQLYTAVGQNIAGLQSLRQGHVEGAVTQWREASSHGYAKAQFNLGLCYETGQGVKRSYAEAVKYYKMAASYDHPQALYNLALLYMDGCDGVSQDTGQAVDLLERAAAQGLPQAQLYLGVFYLEEEHLDLKKAAAYFTAAAEQDNTEGQYYLGVCYENGMGVEENLCKAAHLYGQAAKSGHKDATHNLALFHFYGLGGLPVNIPYGEELLRRCMGLEGTRSEGEIGTGPGGQAVSQSGDVLATGSNTRATGPETEGGPPVKVRMKTAVSSPSLTDYVRENLAKLGLSVPQREVPSVSLARGDSTQPSGFAKQWVVSPSIDSAFSEMSREDQSSDEMADPKAMFNLGADEDDDGYQNWSDADGDSMFGSKGAGSPDVASLANCSNMLYHRHSTMPDLMAVSCT